jgi:glycosyltransferase involved in cell wall biosynthesis
VRLYDWFDFLGWEAERHEYLGLANNSVRMLARRPAQLARAEIALRRQSQVQDVTIISREASPLSTGRLEADLLRAATRGIFDFDDAIYLGGGRIRNLIDQAAKVRRAAGAADVVIVGNDILADWATSHSDNVEVIPSCVNPNDYTTKTDYDLPDAPKLLWVGSPSTERYLAAIGDGLAEVNRRTGATVLAVSGPIAAPSVFDQWPNVIKRIAWDPRSLAATLSSADLALAPLGSDPYSRGKCAYKLLQYAAAGLPMVGSPVGANDAALGHFNGIRVQTPGDWPSAILSLLGESASARRQRGQAALRGVADHYSFQAWSDQWQRAVTGSPVVRS